MCIYDYMDLKITRSDCVGVDRMWTLLYGRRKVGKTYLLKNFTKLDHYALVSRDGVIWIDHADVDKFNVLDDFTKFAMNALKSGKKIAIDEFQRLPQLSLERISTLHPDGVLILSGSNLSMARKVVGTNSPLLGLFRECSLGLIKPSDALRAMKADPAKSVDYATYIRDPWLIPFMRGKDIIEDLYEVTSSVPHTIPALVGEIFLEEDRTLTATYEGILRCLGSGISMPSRIASALYGRRIVQKDSASVVAPFIKNLENMGLIRAIAIYGKKKCIYRMTSPIFSIYYYLADRYRTEDNTLPLNTVRATLETLHTFAVEMFIGELLTERYGGYYMYSYDPEIDAIIADRKGRILAVAETKWGKVSKSDISTFLDKVSHLPGDKLFISKQTIDSDEVKVLSGQKLLDFAFNR